MPWSLPAARLPPRASSARRSENRVEKLICADAVVSDLDEVMARFYAGATSALRSNAECIKPDQQAWLRRRDTCRDSACLDRAYRERLGELMALQPGINVRRRLDVPDVPRLVGALAPEPDRIMGVTLTARGYLSPKAPATPQFDRRHCIYLYRAAS